MIQRKRKRVKSLAYYAHNSKCVAGIRYGNLLRSVRGKQGILKRAGAIAWNAGVIERAAADGVARLEVQIRDGATYTTSIHNLLQNGQIQYRDGRQLVLSLRYWSIDGRAPGASELATHRQDEAPAAQLPLFGVTYEN